MPLDTDVISSQAKHPSQIKNVAIIRWVSETADRYSFATGPPSIHPTVRGMELTLAMPGLFQGA